MSHAYGAPIGPIPASAGEPPQEPPATLRRGAYPRECGGTSGSAGEVIRPTGLSPRVRGNPQELAVAPADRGPIPASAGEPAAAWRGARASRAYPRECGGTSDWANIARSYEGLSPRVRGNPGVSFPPELASGPIPASAGEPRPCSLIILCARAYPRACGGTGLSRCRNRKCKGLSPRVRGNLLQASG